MSRLKRWSYFVCLGGFVYWSLDILVQWIRPPHYTWISALTFLVPLCTVATWAFLAKERHYEHRRSLALLMLLGVWLFGPLRIAVGVAPGGGTFLSPENIPEFFGLWAVFPATTFMMSTYSGSLGGVLLVTLLGAAAALGGKMKRASNKALQGDGPRPAGSARA